MCRARSIIMRTKIKHVVYYMIENRSFDHVCGWLYEKGEEGITFVGPRMGLSISRAPSIDIVQRRSR